MSIEQNKAIARRYVEEVWGKAHALAVEQLVHPDITVAYPLFPQIVRGREAFKQALARIQTALPDIQVSIHELIAEGDKVVARWSIAGTQLGAFGPIPATGKAVRWTGISICRVFDGKVIDDLGEEDALGLMRQLGVVPTPGQKEPAAAR